MASITTRTGKGSPLTHVEVDNNFTNLNTAKLEAGAIALGNAGTPSISFTGDLNTGIFSNGADQLSITTAGEQRFKVGPNGHVALGAGSTITDFNFLNIQGSNLTHTVGVVLNKTDATAQIWAMKNTGPLTFYNYTANTAALTITTAGNVGIGTGSPSTVLHLNTLAGNNTLQAFSLADSVKAYIGLSAVTNSPISGATVNDLCFRSENANIRFGAASSTRSDLTITTAGNVGIGTGNTGPTKALEVAAGGTVGGGVLVTGSSSPQILLTAGGSVSVSIQADGSAGYFGTSTNHLLVFRTNDTEKARIRTDGMFEVKGAGVSGSSPAFSVNGSAPANSAIIDTSGRLLVGTTTVSGLDAAKTVVKETTAAAVQRLVGNTGAQGNAQKITVVRYYPIVSLGTKLIIPFASQVSINTVTLCKVTGLRSEYNSNSPLPFEINFAVGHTNALFNLSSYGGQGNFASIAASGLNVEITFTTAYTSGGIVVCIEYIPLNSELSINVPNIAMN